MPTKRIAAKYTITSNIDLAGLLRGTRGEKIWTAGKPLNLSILVAPGTWRASWSDPDGKERYRLLRTPGGSVHLIEFVGGTVRTLGKPVLREVGGRVEIDWRDVRHPKYGPVRRAVAHLALSDSQTVLVTLDAMVQGAQTSAPLTHLWLAFAPWLGEAASTLGLPVSMRLDLMNDTGGTAEFRLESLQATEPVAGAFDLPDGLKEITAQSRHSRLKGSPAPAPAPGPPAAPVLPPALFSGLGSETVKVIFNQILPDSILSDVRSASSYITGFSGTRFVIPTSDWFTQIIQNAPVPTDSLTRSVIPGLMVRFFVDKICRLLHDLNLTAPAPDVNAAIEALPDSDDKKKLKSLLAAVARDNNLRAAFSVLLERIVPGLGPTSPQPDEDVCVTLDIEDLQTQAVPFAAHPFVRLAQVWYGLLLPSINIRPKYRSRQEIEDAVAVFHANGEVTIDELADLVDINLNDFEHSITFGNQALFTPPVYVDTAALRLIGQLQPWFRPLQNIRFGFLTEFSLAGAEVSCDIDITPALTAATAVLGFFCPPCVLSLFMTGSASASIEDARFPVFLYLEQDPLRLDPPRWRTVFAEPQIGDVDANAFLIGFNVILVLIIDVIANIAGGFILNEILKSLGSELGDAVDGILAGAPVLDAGAIARLGRDPDSIFPPNENSRVAYEAPPRIGGGYQFETFRQASGGSSGTLEFPPAGGALDTALALVLGSTRASKLLMDLTWPRHFGTFDTRKPDGSVSEIDWWAEAPDQTGMPPRPPQAQSGPPPGVILTPPNVGQSWWTFNTILDVHLTSLGWRNLTDSPASQPVADVMVNAWCRGEAVETEIIMYQDCQDVSHLAAGLADRWRIPRGPVGPTGPSGPGDPVGPIEPVERVARGGPGGLMISGQFVQRRGRPGDGGEFGPGWGDGSTVGYSFDPGADYPRPDDPGPTQEPGTFLCRDIVTLNTRQRETWVEASMQFPLPVYVGLTERISYLNLDDFVFFPAIHSALGEDYPQLGNINLNLFATGPLQTLNLPANRDWIRMLLWSISTGLAARTGISSLGPFHYDYGIDFVPTLQPEQLQSPLAVLRLASVTTWPAGGQIKKVAFKWVLQQSLLGRA